MRRALLRLSCLLAAAAAVRDAEDGAGYGGGYRGDDRRGGRSARPEHSGGHKKFTGGRKGSQRHGSR